MLRSALFCSLLLICCGCGEKTSSLGDLQTQLVTLPNGQRVRCQVMITATDMQRGMMFQDSLAPDRGMLFVHAKPGNYTYWMYQVRIPLDILWLDRNRRIVEISADTPPCKTAASQCPTYGGKHPALFVVELAGGVARKNGLKLGDTLEFGL